METIWETKKAKKKQKKERKETREKGGPWWRDRPFPPTVIGGPVKYQRRGRMARGWRAISSSIPSRHAHGTRTFASQDVWCRFPEGRGQTFGPDSFFFLLLIEKWWTVKMELLDWLPRSRRGDQSEMIVFAILKVFFDRSFLVLHESVFSQLRGSQFEANFSSWYQLNPNISYEKNQRNHLTDEFFKSSILD